MRLVIQRVDKASVKVNQKIINKINRGLLVFLGIHTKDDTSSIDFLIEKLINLRIFEDNKNKMNCSIKDIDGQILLISQFTLYANCSKGRRPSFIEAKEPSLAKEIYDIFFERLKKVFPDSFQGRFGANMKISLVNDGPVTIIIEKVL